MWGSREGEGWKRVKLRMWGISGVGRKGGMRRGVFGMMWGEFMWGVGDLKGRGKGWRVVGGLWVWGGGGRRKGEKGGWG